MKVKIFGSVPTAYQYSSLLKLTGRQPVKTGGGAYISEILFDTVKEAREWIRNRAWNIYEGDRREIRNNSGRDYLTYDAATCSIEKLNL